MPKEPNRLLRLLVPLLLLGVGGGFVFFVVMRNTAAKTPMGTTSAPSTQIGSGGGAGAPSVAPPVAPSGATTPAGNPGVAAKSEPIGGGKPATATPAATPTVPTATTSPASAPAGTSAPDTGPSMGAAPAAAQGAYVAKAFPFTEYTPIGSVTPREQRGTFEMEVRFSSYGAGVERLELANYFTTIRQTEHEVIQTFRGLPPGLVPDSRYGLCPFAMNKLEVDGTVIDLGLTADAKQTFWKQTAPGAFEAEIDAGDGTAALRITRKYELAPGAFELALRQRVENLTGRTVKVVWHQFGPASLPAGTIRYGGDVRRVRFGYQVPKAKDPDRLVLADDRGASLVPYMTALGEKTGTFGNTALPRWEAKTLWPNADSAKGELALAWAGTSGRYFTVAMYPWPASGAATTPGRGDDKAFAMAADIDRLAIPTGEPPQYSLTDWLMGRERKPIGELVLRMNSPAMTIGPGKSVEVALGVYAGPSSRKVIDRQPESAAAGIGEIVMYTFGGPCGFCTFQWVAALLHGLLAFLATHVVHDWALAIMLLVICVRTTLHPITRWSQKSLYKFGKEMGKLAPKQKALQEKFKDDPAKLREEQARLMREEGVNYAGALGCLPAFLQTPVWIGLSAMIFFAFDLRHTPAFFGVFQGLSNHAWGFLGDMSEPDHVIPFGRSFSVPVLSSFMGPIDGLNLLPLILGVVFFIQQKYLTPPPSAPLTPEQEQQQKMMKVITVVMFPVMMYNAPAGLALYFATNSTVAIVESKLIRRKAEEEFKEREAVVAARIAAKRSGVGSSLTERRLPKPEGFFAKLRRMAEDAQKSQQAKAKGKGGRK